MSRLLRLWPHAVAAILCAGALVFGARTTGDLSWPYDPDHFRDIAHAQTILDGQWFADPFFAGESVWYNPLLPSVLAAAAWVSGAPLPIVAARAGAYLNVAAPIAFYVLVFRLFSAPAALAALTAFIFMSHGPTWATPTYTPWLFGSVFAQPFFYLTLTALHMAVGSRRLGCWLAVGAGLGVTFLAHTGAALLAGVAIAVVGLAVRLESESLIGRAMRVAVALSAAIVIAAPFLASIVGRYGLDIRNTAPLNWFDPALPAADPAALWRMVAPRALLNTLLLIGAAALVVTRASRASKAIVGVWFFAAAAFFAYSHYGVLWLQARGVAVSPIVPAHHFLLYERAAELVLAGVGIAWAAELAAGLLPPGARRWAASALLAGLLAAITLLNYQRFLQRDDYTRNRHFALGVFQSPEFQAVIPWIRSNTSADDVFLTAESAALSIVGPAGRRSVVAPKDFANPYVEWFARKDSERSMWDALATGDCQRFRANARAMRVTHVMTAEGRTPPIDATACGLEATSFAGRSLAIYRLAGRRMSP
jgi:hypothetical protein